jgi:tRNA-splicing ligase RtcB
MRVHFDEAAGQRVPVCVWRRDPADSTLRQLERIAAQSYVVRHVAAMADAHVAEGVAVGTVFATRGEVVPGALGGDLGCGVRALPLGMPVVLPDHRSLMVAIERLGASIPVGDAIHRRAAPLPSALAEVPLSTGALRRAQAQLGPRHLGTLGGGNHFLEIDRAPEGELWLLVHSGSRGLGAAIAGHHRRVAGVDPLAALAMGDEAGVAYLADAAWALGFARENRARIAAAAARILAELLGVEPALDQAIDVHHNFCTVEEHDGERLWVHRKGAIAVPAGALAVIPGSMGTASYIVRGRGSAASFDSCSHGAGRVLSRAEARARIPPRTMVHTLRRVVFDIRRAADLVEEAPAVYRDIREVLEDQADLVEPVLRLEPLAVLKG